MNELHGGVIWLAVLMHMTFQNSCAQMVGKLLGQQNHSGSAMLGASVSPGDIGIICFHRAQV